MQYVSDDDKHKYKSIARQKLPYDLWPEVGEYLCQHSITVCKRLMSEEYPGKHHKVKGKQNAEEMMHET